MKLTHTFLAISIFSAAQLVSAQAEKPYPFVDQLLEKYYPHNEKALKIFNKNELDEKTNKQCHFKEYKDPEQPMAGYCMKFVSEELVDTAQGKRRYIFLSGDRLTGCKDCLGLNSLFVFTSTDGKDWQLVKHKEIEGGHGYWGRGSVNVKWLETGPGLWGIASEQDYMLGGERRSTVILHDDGKEIRDTVIRTYFDGLGGPEYCNDEKNLKLSNVTQAECYANSVNLKATIDERKDLPAVDNTYPLQVTVDGYDGMKLIGEGKDAKGQPIKEYKQEKFIFSYDAEKHDYITPANYPEALTSSAIKGN